VHTSEVYRVQVHTCYLILIEVIGLIPGNINVLGTSEMNMLSAG